ASGPWSPLDSGFSPRGFSTDAMHRFLSKAGLLSLGLVPGASWAETISLTLRNGDSLHGELIERNPENGTTVLN
mgnify:CR=1